MVKDKALLGAVITEKMAHRDCLLNDVVSLSFSCGITKKKLTNDRPQLSAMKEKTGTETAQLAEQKRLKKKVWQKRDIRTF